jgi:GTP-binding protein
VERCAALLLVVDLGAGVDGRVGARPAEQLRTLRAELAAYDASLAHRPALVVGTKLDLSGAPRALAGLRRSAAAAGMPRPLGVSATTGEGVEGLRAAVLALSALATAEREG